MKWRQMQQLLARPVSTIEAFAMDYLEWKGLRFCVDFGYENALVKAVDLFAHEMEDL